MLTKFLSLYSISLWKKKTETDCTWLPGSKNGLHLNDKSHLWPGSEVWSGAAQKSPEGPGCILDGVFQQHLDQFFFLEMCIVFFLQNVKHFWGSNKCFFRSQKDTVKNGWRPVRTWPTAPWYFWSSSATSSTTLASSAGSVEKTSWKNKQVIWTNKWVAIFQWFFVPKILWDPWIFMASISRATDCAVEAWWTRLQRSTLKVVLIDKSPGWKNSYVFFKKWGKKVETWFLMIYFLKPENHDTSYGWSPKTHSISDAAQMAIVLSSPWSTRAQPHGKDIPVLFQCQAHEAFDSDTTCSFWREEIISMK